MSDFDQAIGVLLRDEGGNYVAEDHGRGPSKWGITLRTYQQTHPNATATDIQAMDQAGAAAFYRSEYWERYHIGRIADQDLATKVLDLAVNMGPGTAIMLVQGCVGVKQDGVLGDQTAAKVAAGNPAVILNDLRAAAKAHYEQVAAAHPDWAGDLAGWLARAEA